MQDCLIHYVVVWVAPSKWYSALNIVLQMLWCDQNMQWNKSSISTWDSHKYTYLRSWCVWLPMLPLVTFLVWLTFGFSSLSVVSFLPLQRYVVGCSPDYKSSITERERRAMATVAKCYKLFHAIKTQNQTPLGTRHPSRVWFRDNHSPGLYWTSQTTPAVWDTVVSETLNPESLTDYQGSDYSSHEPTRLSDETIICSSFEQKSNFISQCNSNGYQDHSQGHNPAQRIPYIHWKKFYKLLRWLLRDAPSCLPSAFSARVSP